MQLSFESSEVFSRFLMFRGYSEHDQIPEGIDGNQCQNTPTYGFWKQRIHLPAVTLLCSQFSGVVGCCDVSRSDCMTPTQIGQCGLILCCKYGNEGNSSFYFVLQNPQLENKIRKAGHAVSPALATTSLPCKSPNRSVLFRNCILSPARSIVDHQNRGSEGLA